jgi:dipeptidyl aminopeptidase/acylaminoacyl peptidase
VLKRAAVAMALALAALWPGWAAAQAEPATRFLPQDIFALSRASDPQVRPDGGLVAYVRTTNDIMSDRGRRAIWLIDARTGDQTPLGGADVDAFGPRWSPDGSRIAFVAAPPGETPAIYVHWMASGQTALVARPARDPLQLSWSPDGRTIAFVMSEPAAAATMGAPLARPEGAQWAGSLQVIGEMTYRTDGVGYLKPGHTHLFVVAADGGAPRQLTFGKFDDDGPLSWAADGHSIVFAARRDETWEREPFRSAIYRVAIESGTLTRLTTQAGPDASARISPDGKHIAFSGYDDRYRGYENRRIYVMDADGGHVTPLAPGLDRSLDHPVWSADGRSLYADYVDHGVTKVARLSLAGGVEEAASGLAGDGLDLPYSGGEFSVTKDGAVAITLGAADHPADIALVRAGKVIRLTRLNDGLLSHKALAPTEPLAVVSSVDKALIDAWMLKPPGFDPSKKYPLILEIHGGPFASYGPVFTTDDQLYAAAGYVVIYANPRGSTSYGEVFANGIDRAYPGTDYDDLMSAVDAAVAKGFVDSSRLFVTGGSGGGVLTAWIVGKTHRFRAAVAQKPVVNWSSEVLTNDLYAWMARYWFGKQPWEDPVNYWKRSPLSLVGEVTTPTMVVVGDRDLRTPDAEAEQYFDALMLRGVPTTLVKVPGAFHDMAARPSQSAAKANAVLAWFARYDTGAARP